MMRTALSRLLFLLACLASPFALFAQAFADDASLQTTRIATPDQIKAFCLDFNWAGRRGFANPGTWKDADPVKHVAWHRQMGNNVIQTFCVSTNGYAWYKNGVVPEQPGLKHDFLREVVRLGHASGMQVFGYFCIGANTRWGEANPELSYGTPSTYHLPYTDAYLDYLSKAIHDAVATTGIDGFMIDWVWMPKRVSKENPEGRWINAEKKLYEQLMGEPFPGEEKLTKEQDLAYSRKAIDRCWETIRKAAKGANPDCIIWLTSNLMDHPHVANSAMYREVDWLMAERGNIQKLIDSKKMVRKDTHLITCFAAWNGKDASREIPAAQEAGVGLYGFARPQQNGVLDLDNIFSKQVNELTGDLRNIGVLARANHGKSHHSKWVDGEFVEPRIPCPVDIAFRPRGRGTQDTGHIDWKANSVIIQVRTPYQEGRGAIDRAGDQWPETVKIQLKKNKSTDLPKNFRMSNGSLGFRVSFEDGRAAQIGSAKVQMEVRKPWMKESVVGDPTEKHRLIQISTSQTDEHIEITIPAAIFEGNPPSVVYEWGDLHGGKLR